MRKKSLDLMRKKSLFLMSEKSLFFTLSFLFLTSIPYTSFSQDQSPPIIPKEETPLQRMLFHLPSLEGKERVDTLNEIAFEYLLKNENLDGVIAYGEEALNIATTMSYDTGQAYALTRIALAHRLGRNYLKAIEFGERSVAIRKRIGGFILVAGYHNLADPYRLIGDYEKSLQLEDSSIQICQAVLDKDPENQRAKELMVKAYRTIGDTYKSRQQYSHAVEAYQEGLRIGEQMEEKKVLIQIYLLLGIAYKDQGIYKTAAEYFEQALAAFKSNQDEQGIAITLNNLGELYYLTQQYPPAITNYKESLALYEKKKDDLRVGEVLNNLGGVYESMGDYVQAKDYFKRALSLHTTLNYPKGKAEALYSIGALALAQAEIEEAISQLEASRAIADSLNILHLRLRITSALTEAYEQQQAYPQAFANSEARAAIAESLSSDKEHTLSLLFNLEEERNKNAYQADLREKEQTLSQTKIIALSVVSGLLLLIIFAIMRIYTDRQRIQAEHQQVMEANYKVEVERLHTKEAYNKIDKLLADQEVETLKARVETRENEQTRIGQDLHDQLGGLLSAIKGYFISIDKKLGKISEEIGEVDLNQYKKAGSLLDEAVDKVREISHNLSSGILKKYGLVAAIRSLCNRVKDSELVDVEFHAFEVPERLSKEVESAVYRIIQELFSNILKHAKAKEVTVQVSFYNDLKIINLTVEDDGVGFDYQPDRKYNGIGLSGIADHVKMLRGDLKIDSQKGRGTTVMVDIPV